MKRTFITVLLLTAAAGLLFAQGLNMRRAHGPIVDAKTPPPLPLPDAYAAAMSYVGPATNRWWCISGSCGEDYGTTRVTHWEFRFSNTNRETAVVLVFFDKSAYHMEGAAVVKGTLK